MPSGDASDLLGFIEACLGGDPQPADWDLINDAQTRAVLRVIAEHDGTSDGGPSVVDIGCGNLRLLNAMSSQLPDIPWSYVGVDISPPEIPPGEWNRERRVQVIELAAYDAPSSADVVVVQNVTHELSTWDIIDLLVMAKRTLRPTGVLVFSDLGFLPFGEPRFVPLVPAELDALFDGATQYDFTTKSGVPVLFRVVERRQIPFPYQTAATLRVSLALKRSAFAELARRIETGEAAPESLGLGRHRHFDYVYLSLLVANITSRLSERSPGSVSQDRALDIVGTIESNVFDLAAFRKSEFEELLELLHQLSDWDYWNLYAALEWFESRGLVFPIRIVEQFMPTGAFEVMDANGGFEMLRGRLEREFNSLHRDALELTGGAGIRTSPWIP